MTAPSRNKVVHRIGPGGGTWCGIRGPWQEERRPIQEVPESWTEQERYWDPYKGEFGGWAYKTVRRKGLVRRRVGWYSYQDQVATSHWDFCDCPRCIDGHQRALEEQRRKAMKRNLIIFAVALVAILILVAVCSSGG